MARDSRLSENQKRIKLVLKLLWYISFLEESQNRVRIFRTSRLSSSYSRTLDNDGEDLWSVLSSMVPASPMWLLKCCPWNVSSVMEHLNF